MKKSKFQFPEPQMTKEQAISFHDSGAWKHLGFRARAELGMSQQLLCMPFSVLHEALEKTIGRPVYTHEFGINWQGLYDEVFNEGESPSLKEIIEMLPGKEAGMIVIDDISKEAK